ncbi:MAG: calycin-like domain-containing protein [Prevotella sp.]
MKKTFTIIALLAFAAASFATDFTDRLKVTILGTSGETTINTITVNEQSNGKYELTLKNFEMTGMSVGTIHIVDADAVTDGATTLLSTTQNINIAAGDIVPSNGIWVGPQLGEVPVKLNAKMTSDHLYAIISISFTGLDIDVVFGDTYQIANSDFELFHTAHAGNVSSDEPDCWHSFMSCTGALSSVVSTVPHTFISNEVRPGSFGKTSVLIKSGMAMGIIVANGTLTTGRLMAGGYSATSTDNNAFLDITSTDKDENGDPFYSLLSGRPDSISLWVRFKQETEQADHPYATMSAVITDGSFYQEPCDKDYTDIIVGRAVANTIASNGFTWQRVCVPFDYDSFTEKDGKAILVTLSTNADPGQGTGNDELYVDDLALIYNSQLASLSVKGAAVEGFSKDKYSYEVNVNGSITAADIDAKADGRGAKVTKELVSEGSDVKALITVTSDDMRTSNTYTVTLKGAVNAISDVKAREAVVPQAVYNLNGQRVTSTRKGNIYISKGADGNITKTVMK